jgi:hypothetical protein
MHAAARDEVANAPGTDDVLEVAGVGKVAEFTGVAEVLETRSGFASSFFHIRHLNTEN